MLKEIIFSAAVAIIFAVFFILLPPTPTGQITAANEAEETQEDARGEIAFVKEISIEKGELLLINETVAV